MWDENETASSLVMANSTDERECRPAAARDGIPSYFSGQSLGTSVLLVERRLLSQQMVVVLCEAVCFVADVLQQSEAEAVAAEAVRFGFAG